MPKFIVNLHAHISYDYVVEADDKEEAIAKARERHEISSLQEQAKHEYDYRYLEPDAYADEKTFDLKGSILCKGAMK